MWKDPLIPDTISRGKKCAVRINYNTRNSSIAFCMISL